MKERIVFFGAGPYVIPIIEELNKNFELVSVVTTEKSGPTISFCKKNNILFISVGSSSEIINNQQSIINCRIAVLASFGLIVSDEILNSFELGIINIHPSLLPEYRGTTPVQTAILDGKTTTGVSIMKLDAEIDHGPILAQEEIEIELSDTSESLYNKAFKLGAEILVDVLPKYITGELKPTEQDHSKATYTDHLTRESGFIDLNQESRIKNQELERMIRAYYPWPGVWFRIPVIASGAKQSSLSGKIIKLFPENRIQVEGKNIMSLKDFINGYPEGKEILTKLGLS